MRIQFEFPFTVDRDDIQRQVKENLLSELKTFTPAELEKLDLSPIIAVRTDAVLKTLRHRWVAGAVNERIRVVFDLKAMMSDVLYV